MRRSSESSLLSYHSVDLASNPRNPEPVSGSERGSELEPESGRDSGREQEQEKHPEQEPRRHSAHRVHFGSDLRYEYGNSTEDEPSSSPKAEESAGSGHRRSLSDRVRSWMARLRTPYEEDGDLQPGHHSRPSSPAHEEARNGEDHPSSEAHRLVREVTHDAHSNHHLSRHSPHVPNVDGTGILSQLLRLSNSTIHDMSTRELFHPHTPSQPQSQSQSQGPPTPRASPGSNTPTPKKKPKWYKKPNNSGSTLLAAAAPSTFHGTPGSTTPISSEMMSAASKRLSQSHPHGTPGVRLEDEIQITLQIAEILSRQRYIIQLCRALMVFGAPTHRLEEYMRSTAHALQVDSQYLYLPGCMIISFDDSSTRTTEVKLVRVSESIDLGRLADTHNIYKSVLHDVIGIEEASEELDQIMHRAPRFNKWIIVFVYGLATAVVGPYAYDARPIDMPLIFANGIILGVMQHVLAPRSVLYSNVFEVTASVVTSFIARALGSITTSPTSSVNRDPIQDPTKPNYLFCFSAIAQSSIALILPGYTVLCSSLELQSHQFVAGSVRMVYAIIYSLFLGYGITVGTTIYGLIDGNAVSATTCPATGGGRIQNPYAQRFPFVALFAACILLVNQGKWRQAPIMVFIAECGYVTNYFVTRRLGTTSQVANTVGAFTIGVMGNLYSRIWHGHAATAILPGIFVLVPSGLAASGTLISGIESANEARGNVSSNANSSSSSSSVQYSGLSQSTMELGYGMVQVAISISVGLFVAALVVYPLGKRRSGLFSF